MPGTKKRKGYSATISCPSTRVNLPRKAPYLHAHVCRNLWHCGETVEWNETESMLCFQYITRRACDDANVFQIIAGMLCSWPPDGILNKMASSTSQTYTHKPTNTHYQHTCPRSRGSGYQAYRFHNLLKIISSPDLSACVVMCVRICIANGNECQDYVRR